MTQSWLIIFTRAKTKPKRDTHKHTERGRVRETWQQQKKLCELRWNSKESKRHVCAWMFIQCYLNSAEGVCDGRIIVRHFYTLYFLCCIYLHLSWMFFLCWILFVAWKFQRNFHWNFSNKWFSFRRKLGA